MGNIWRGEDRMTELLFYDDAYLKTAAARVVHIEQTGVNWKIACDRTIFYPEGGGQPADRGTLAGHAVVDVKKQEGTVYHLLEQQPQFAVGDTVAMELDWAHRYEYMQQHTGQHVLSGVLYRAYGIGTVSIHQGEQYTAIETDRDEIDETELREVEQRTQELICSNLAVSGFLVDEGDQQAMSSLRREPQVGGAIRVVAVGDYDRAPCGGVHLKRTGEILLVHCIGTEQIRGRIRTLWKIGRRALEDYRDKTAVLGETGTLLSSPWEEIPHRISHLQEEFRQLQWEKRSLLQRAAEDILNRHLSSAKHLGNIRFASGIIALDDPELFKQIPSLISLDQDILLCLIGRTDDGTLRWLMGAGEKVDVPFREVRKLLAHIDGKGGGRHPLWQGIGRNPRGAEQFLADMEELFK